MFARSLADAVPARYWNDMGVNSYSEAGGRSGKRLQARGAALASAASDRVFGWRRKAATIAAGALAVALAYGVVFGHNGLTAFAHKRKETRDLQLQMEQLQAENDRIRGRVDHLQTDPGAIEHEAREDLHYTRAGEVIVTLPSRPASKQQLPPE